MCFKSFIFVAGESIIITTQINKMAVCRVVVFLFLVMVVVVPFAAGKIRGVGCTPKNCKWAHWERWMECDQLCGGIQLRHRSPNVTESCGGTARAALRKRGLATGCVTTAEHCLSDRVNAGSRTMECVARYTPYSNA